MDGAPDERRSVASLSFENIFSRFHKFEGVNAPLVHMNFVVQMRTCASAGISHLSDFCPIGDVLSAFDVNPAQMSIACENTVTVIDLYKATETALLARVNHFAGRTRKYGGAMFGAKIDATMHRLRFVDRVRAHAVPA